MAKWSFNPVSLMKDASRGGNRLPRIEERVEAAKQGEMMRAASIKAGKFAEDQRKQSQRALSKLNAGRARAARGRVRGGLFGSGDTGLASSLSQTLGG